MSFGLQLTYQGPAHHCGEGPEAHGFNATKELTWPCIRICYCRYQCCGSGIRCLFDPWIRDPDSPLFVAVYGSGIRDE
jgi:hypothetical protein